MAFVFKTQYAHDAQPTEATQSYKAGFYPAKIVAAEEKYSKSGKPMFELTLEVDPGGIKTLDVKEYLLLEGNASWKIEQYLAAIGMQFGQGQNITVDATTFLGGRLFLLTCNEPGQKNPDRLYMKPMKAFRKQDIPHDGPLTEGELEHWGLNPDGTRKGSREEQRANAQPMRQQGGFGHQQGGWNNQQQYPPQAQAHLPQYQTSANNWPQQGYAQPAYQPQQGQAPMHEEADDDIPF